MGGKLPPHVSISDSDAPWNQSYPDPSDIRITCTDCDWSGTVAESYYDGIPYCSVCGGDVKEL